MVDWPPDRPQSPGNLPEGHEKPEFPGRRSFLGLLLGVGVVLVGALLSAPLFRFVLFPLLRTTTKTRWADIGPMSDFSSLSGPVRKDINVEQVDAWRELYSQKSVFVIPWPKNENGGGRVLSAVCPHLGCLVHYNKDKNEFLCPCHGSIFASDGKLVRGPAERGLDPLPHKIRQGNLMVLYQYFRELIAKREVIG